MEKYTLIIAEKPIAAQRIAEALNIKGKPAKLAKNGMPYYVAQRERTLVVVPALGHLYTVEGKKRGSDYPVFDFRWVPRYITKKDAGKTRHWLKAISELAENADTFIDACDYDIEGSVIGYNILKCACNDKERFAKRMKFSTLTKEDVEKSYAKPYMSLDFGLIEAGLTRHEIDWLYGINLSRALTTAAKDYSKRYTTLSMGRVQGPTLEFVARREEFIKSFVPIPYWTITASIVLDRQNFKAKYEKETIETRADAQKILDDCRGKDGQIKKIASKELHQMPPAPFDLGSLQSETYRIFRYMPRYTLSIAQQLYLDTLISYPRTDSQKLPATINFAAILKGLSQAREYMEAAKELLAKTRLIPHEGTKEDPAHPAIYPTGNMPKRILTEPERRIWDLIVRRFMSVFGEPVLRQKLLVWVDIGGHVFWLEGNRVLNEGWTHFYRPYIKSEEAWLPPIREKQIAKIRRIEVQDKFTNPPARYNPSSLLKKMELMEIGTKATRADIIQTLYNRKYIKDEAVKTTGLGFEILSILKKFCPSIVSVKLTRQLEQALNDIQRGKEKRENIVTDTIRVLAPEMEILKQNKEPIGRNLDNVIRRERMEERVVGTCPVCESGNLIILRSRKTGKQFIGCTDYFEGKCKTSFPLPQLGTVKPSNRKCRACTWPTVYVQTARRRRLWNLCFNPKCPLKTDRTRET